MKRISIITSVLVLAISGVFNIFGAAPRASAALNISHNCSFPAPSGISSPGAVVASPLGSSVLLQPNFPEWTYDEMTIPAGDVNVVNLGINGVYKYTGSFSQMYRVTADIKLDIYGDDYDNALCSVNYDDFAVYPWEKISLNIPTFTANGGTYHFKVRADVAQDGSGLNAIDLRAHDISVLNDTAEPTVYKLGDNTSNNPMSDPVQLSINTSRLIRVYGSDTTSSIVEAEYFVGSDPGEGNGTELTRSNLWLDRNLYPANDWLQGTVDTYTYDEPTTTTLNVRVMDATGQWSDVESRQLVIGDWDTPTLGPISWGNNPIPVGGSTHFVLTTHDVTTEVVSGEYFIGLSLDDDPGVGNGIPVGVQDGFLLSDPFGSDLAPGVYFVGVRGVDKGGNWSELSTSHLVVFSPDGPDTFAGQGHIKPGGSDILPWISSHQRDSASFGYEIKRLADGSTDPVSALSFDYSEKGNCKNQNPSTCHTFILTSTSFDTLSILGGASELGVAGGTATLEINGVTSTVEFALSGKDGDRLTPAEPDTFTLEIYPVGSTTLLYQVDVTFDPNSESKGKTVIE